MKNLNGEVKFSFADILLSPFMSIWNMAKSEEDVSDDIELNPNSSDKIEAVLANNQNEIDKKMGKIDSRIEGLGSIFLNIVLTISITTTMVTVLLDASPRYSLVIVLGCAWLLLSAILFVGSYFKSDSNPKNKLAVTVYVILSIITFFSFIYCFYSEDPIVTRKDNVNIENSIQ